VFSLNDKKLAADIISKMKNTKYNLKFMHVCGTHQDTLVKNGLDSLLRTCGIEIGQGPGCPVCVTTTKEIEEILEIARKGKIVTSYGDMMRVPGLHDSLQRMKAQGYDIRTIYGIEDAVKIARDNPDKEIVFMAVGFETTAPATAAVILDNPPGNFSILSCHRTIPSALKTILEMGEIKLDGLIQPGHVSTIIGIKPYELLAEKYNIAQVIAGFEPIDLLMGSWMLLNQIKEKKVSVQNEYSRVVKYEGNIKAQKILEEVFISIDKKWRGFPIIKKSGLELKERYEKFNARKKYEDILESIQDKEFKEPKGCRCGELLRGLINPYDCPLFGKICSPDKPIGPCMVSIEGSCNIEFRYSSK
jgi:hydrogenase expression/formation protein HypD